MAKRAVIMIVASIYFWMPLSGKENLSKEKKELFDAYKKLGRLLIKQYAFEEAMKHLENAIAIKNNDPHLLLSYANLLESLNKNEKALKVYKKILTLVPNSPDILFNIAMVFKKQKKIDKSLQAYKQALKRDPSAPHLHFGIATLYLTMGNFKEGWKEYEWRWKKKLKPRDYKKPRWDGSDLKGKTLLIHAEQGLGDTFQFIRYAKAAKAMGAYVIVAPQKPLVNILSLCPYIDEIIPFGQEKDNFDVHAPLMSMPFLCNTTEETIPSKNAPYLHADQILIKEWATLLQKNKNFKIGICWHGSTGHKGPYWKRIIEARCIKLNMFKPISEIPGITLYSLQKISGTEQVKNCTFKLHTFGSTFDNQNGSFMDTSAVIKNLDLVITVDTSIAHLAGGLGAPTWVLLGNNSDWRWMLDRSDSPWYPTVKLFRQREAENWTDVIKEVAHELRTLIIKKLTEKRENLW